MLLPQELLIARRGQQVLQRLTASFSITVVIMAVTIVGQVVGVPVLIGAWGAQVYGEWIALTNVTAALTLLNLGIQNYMLNLMITHHQHGEISAGTRVLHASLRLYMFLCGVALLVVFGLALWPGLPVWLNITAIPDHHMRVILIIQGLWVTYTLLGGILMSVLLVINQYPRRLRYSLADRLMMLGIPLVIAALGGSPFEAMLVMAVLMVTLAAYQIHDVANRTPFPIGLKQATWSESRALIRPSLMFLAVRIANTLLTSGIVVVISAAAGGTTVALYSTTLMMTNFIRTFANQGLAIFWPEITSAEAGEDNQRLWQWHRLMVKLVFGGVLVLGAGLILFGPDILRIWVGDQVEVDIVLNTLLVYYLIVQASTLVSRVFGLATNHQADLFRIELVTALVTVGLAVPLVSLFGVNGAALALICGQLWNTVRVTAVALDWTHDSVRPFLMDWLGRGWLVIVLLLLTPLGIWFLLSAVWLRAATLTLALLLLGVLAWAQWLNDQDRLLALRMIGSVRRLFARFSPAKG